MKLEYDKSADAAYIYLQFPIKNGEVKKTVEFKENIILDFNSKHKLVGVEILNASKILTRESLKECVC